MRKVALAIDNSEYASMAFQWYLKNIHKENDYLICIHAREIPHMSIDNAIAIQELFAKADEKLKALEQKYTTQMKKANINGRFYVGGGKPGEVVCKVAEEEHVDMIVTGTRGMGTIRRTILGSVSDYLVHHAKVPVVVCRNN